MLEIGGTLCLCSKLLYSMLFMLLCVVWYSHEDFKLVKVVDGDVHCDEFFISSK